MGSEARTRLGLAGLVLATLFAFGQLFSESSYAGPALLGAMLAAGIAIAARRLGVATGTTILVSETALIWYLTLVFEAERTFYGLPSPDALTALARGVARAYDAGSVDYAPVPMRPGYLILSVAAIWTVTTIGEIATFRWKRPLVASLPAVGLFGFLLVVGTGGGASALLVMFLAALLTYWGLESALRLRQWGRWVHAWSASSRFNEEPEAITGAVARRMGISCIAAALIAPLLLPTINEGLLAWRSSSGDGPGDGSGSGSGDGRSVNLLVSLKPKLVNQSELEMFRVNTSSASYWRLASLVQFDGTEWTPLEDAIEVPYTDLGFVDTTLAVGTATREIDQEIVIAELRGDEMPAAVQPATIAFDEGADRSVDDVTYDHETGSLEVEGGLESALSYSVTSTAPDLAYRDLRDAEVGDLGPGYTALPEDTSLQIRAIAEDWTAASESPFEALVAIQNRLRGPDFQYSLDVEPSASGDLLLDFLTVSRTGYCQQFSAAFAALARSLGYPTRVSVGFLQGETDIATPESFVVRGKDAHSWPEVYFQDYGWVAFEPTPRTDIGTAQRPAYTFPGGSGIPGGIDGLEGSGGPEGASSDLPPGSIPDDDLPERLVRLGGNPAERGIGADSPREVISDEWKDAFARLTISLGVALALFLLAVPSLKEARARRRYRRAVDARALAAAAFKHFEDEAADLAAPRSPAETAMAFANRLAALRRVPQDRAVRLAYLYEAAEYAGADLSRGQAVEARRLVRELRARLWARASWWERAARLFSPARLVGRRARVGVLASAVLRRG